MTRTDRRPGQVDDGGDPYAPESSRVRNAGVVTRVLAACVDLVTVVVAAVLLDLAAAGVRFVWSPATFRWPQPTVAVSGSVIMGIGVLYLSVAWATTGRTYGERLLGLRVLSTRLTRLGWTRAILRAITCVVFPVGLVWSAFSSQRYSLQDIVFRTVVVYYTEPYRSPEVNAHGSGRR
jgi:uncharacterized RDD family membrane protein YckC